MTMKAIVLPVEEEQRLAKMSPSMRDKRLRGKARAKFESIRKRILAARAKYDELEERARIRDRLPPRPEPRPGTRWLDQKLGFEMGWHKRLKPSEKRGLEPLRARLNQANKEMYDLLDRISPRDWWQSGVPAWWIAEKLSFEDAIRPTSEPLSETPPLAYGQTHPMR